MREFIVSEDFHPDVKDYPELVRCKNCKKLDTSPSVVHMGCGRCIKLNAYPSEDWFCADGEPKD